MRVILRPQWDQEFSYDESIKILTDFAWSHIKEAGRFKEPLALRLRNRDWLGLCDFKLDYRDDDNVHDLIHARQALAFFEKLEPLRVGVDKERVAWGKFQKSEADCRLTNECFRLVRDGNFSFPPPVNSVLHGAQRKIARILGTLPNLSDLQFRFGPGANTSVKASASTPRWKLGARIECSSELIQSASALLSEAPAWAANAACAETSSSYFVDVTIVNGRLQFVPKNAKTYRSIVVEPILNSFAQLGIGKYLKKRLALCGVDTSDQTRNQRLAHQGSRTGSLATVDLSAASDTISKEVVANLLPLDWFTFLAQYRTGKVEYNGEVLVLEKFSSMGNGFTFELETLIFYALAWSTCESLSLPTGWTSAYGDDLIIPTEAYPLLEQVLRSCGFSVNMLKSFDKGLFRESCGTDYYKGIDIRPFYQKHMVSGQTLFALHNFYARGFDFQRASMVKKRIHPSLHLYGPDGYGDGHLIGDWSHAKRSKTSIARGWEGVRFDTLTFEPKRNMRKAQGDWVVPEYSIYLGKVDEGDRNISIADGYTALNSDNLLVSADFSCPSGKFVVRGRNGYKRVSIYTLRLGVFF